MAPKLTPAQVAAKEFQERERKAKIRAERRKLGRTAGEQAEAQAATRQQRRQRVTAAVTPTGISAPGGNRYQAAILAEFLVAALVVAFAPLASPPKDEKGGPSPYRVGDLGQLAALGIVYFLLAVWSGTGKGRMAAWFGFLVLLGVLFKKTANGQ